MQQWFTLNDPTMEESLHEVPLFCEFAGLNGDTPLPTRPRSFGFTGCWKSNKLAPQILVLVNEMLGAKGVMLRAGTVVDAMLIAVPSSTKNASGECGPQMDRARKATSGTSV